MQALLSDAEDVFNRLTDSERQWWPFGFLQPARAETFSTLRALVLALMQGIPLGFLLIAIDPQARHAATHARFAWFLSIVCATLFAANRLTLAYFWNRRAERMAEDRRRLEAWRDGGSRAARPSSF